jgi:curved DNA-binding protein CbpA
VTSPFEILGLDPAGNLSDDDVRSAWRRAAAATHPDRADGGDPAAFAAAAVAYTALRTAAARREVLADDRDPATSDPATRIAGRMGHGRPVRFAARLLTAVVAGAVPVAVVGWQPASVAIITGALTWLLLTGRRDLPPRRMRSPRGRDTVRP